MRIAAAFDRAEHYDAHAHVQRQVADALAARIDDLGVRPNARVLEIGCGTGFLGAALLPRLEKPDYFMTDIAPAMVERARARFGNRVRFAVLDAAAPSLEGPFDLICSSLALQWVPDLGATVARLRSLLAPGGLLAFTTLAAGSFAEWQAAHGDLSSGTPDYPSQAELDTMGLSTSLSTISEAHGSAAAFLRALKAIGAGTPRPGHRPLSPPALRQAMERFETGGAIAHYVVATCTAGPLV